MALEKRDGNRVFSKYYGKGELACLVVQMDEIKRYEKAEKAELQRKNKEEIEKIDRELSNLGQEIRKLIENVLLNLGFYKTRSREWRLKKR